MNDNIASIKILRSNENTTIAMTYRYYFKKKPDSLGRIKCVIPAFNIIFSVENEINAEARANEFIDVFLKLCVRKFESITKEQAELFERNYSLAIDTILKYKLKNCIVSEVINAAV